MMGEVLWCPHFVSSAGSSYHRRLHDPHRHLHLYSPAGTRRKHLRRNNLNPTCTYHSETGCSGTPPPSKWGTRQCCSSSRSGKTIHTPSVISCIEPELIRKEAQATRSRVLVGKNESRNINQHFSDSEKRLPGLKIHFLEERDEEVLSKRMLILSRTNKVRSALELLLSMEFSGLKPDVHTSNSLLASLLRNGQFDAAMGVFNFMRRNNSTTSHAHCLILKAIAGEQGCDAAASMFEKLESEGGLRNDRDTIVDETIISICGSENDWVQVEKIWRRMKENGIFGTGSTYCLLVSIFVHCSQNDLAIEAYMESIWSGLKPDHHAMQAMIGACAKEGKSELAMNVFNSMMNAGLKPNLIACNTMINSLGRDGKVELAFKIYRLMRSWGHAPDSYTWNGLLGGLYRADRHADAVRLFGKIRKEHSTLLNSQLFNVAIKSCQRLQLWERAVQFLWQMEASKLPVSTMTYNLAISSCEVAKKPKIALQIFEHMVDQQCTPDTFTYLSLARSCIWGRLWDEVEEILEAASNASLYNAVIHGMCFQHKIETAKRLYMRMLEMGLKPDGKTRILMLQKLARDSGNRDTRLYPQLRKDTKQCHS